MQPFIAYIEKLVKLSPQEIEKIYSSIENEKIEKNTILLKAGQICDYNYFVLKGCLRIYLINNNAEEQIMHFAVENWWISDLNSFLEKKPARFYIQALEDSEVIKIKYEKYNELINEIPAFESFIRIIFQSSFAKLQENYIDTLNNDGEKRYLAFVKKYPKLVQRVSQYMIASYLGLTPEFISKIRKKLALKKNN